MSKKLHIAIIQTHLHWENPRANRHNFEEKLKILKPDVDLIVLPEMFTTGFTMNPETIAETMQGETIKWMKEIALKNNFAITGSIVIEEEGQFYNRLLFIQPNGKVIHYDKRHTFTLAGEDKVYSAGASKSIIEYKGWKICPLICYDLRFPVWSRNVDNYDVLIYVANWPQPRLDAWDTLLKARAIENMCYTIGANRLGLDDMGHEYSGHSVVYDVLGNRIAFSDKEEIIYSVLEKEELIKYRKKLKFLDDKDVFNLE